MKNVMIRTARTLGIAAVAGVALGAPSLAAEGAEAPEHHHWHHAGPFGVFDRGALQRGYKIYREVCASCHSMKQLSFRNLGQADGPFFDEDYPNPNDNPVIKALAAEFFIVDGPDDVGDFNEREGRPSDRFPSPFANENAARASNGGAYPPDLSLITKARSHGEDYVRSLLLGYEDPPEGVEVRGGLYYNPYFPGDQIAMKEPITDVLVDATTFDDDTEATKEQMVEDVVTFLAWAADPHQEARKRMGLKVIIYLTILAVLLWFSYKQIWRGVKH